MRWKTQRIVGMAAIAVAVAGGVALTAGLPAGAQQRRAVAAAAAVPSAAAPAPGAAADHGSFLLTIFLRHDQSKPLDAINEQLRKQSYYQQFPPPGVEIVSWYVMMGIGQVVTLRVPAERLREVNRAIEQTAWGPYRTDFYPTYDYKPIAEAERAKAR